MLSKPTRLDVIGVPFSGGQRKAGTEKAPIQLRQKNIVSLLSNHFQVVDQGDVIVDEQPEQQAANCKVKKSIYVGKTCFSLYEKIKEASAAAADQNSVILNIGGDHSIAIGTLYGMLHNNPDLCVIWVDAHADINTPQTSRSGNIHGMPVSFAVQKPNSLHEHWTIPGFEWTKDLPGLDLNRLVYIGLRDVDPGEVEIIAKYNIKHYNADKVHALGIGKVMEEVFAYLPKNGKIHMSLDVDGMDPEFFPSTGTPVPDGLTMDQCRYLCKQVFSCGRCVGLDLVEINPELGDSKDALTTLDNSVEILKCLLDHKWNA